jgi:DNA-binding NarL/FixJ family response regulator
MRTKSPKRRVLIADDSPEITKRLIRAISELPHVQVLQPAGSGSEALERFRAELPEVAILDIQMPGLDALDAIRSMRQSSATATLITYTTHEDDEFRHRFLQAGVDHFFSKRQPLDCLLEIIGKE